MYIYGISQINQVNMICQKIWNLEYNFGKPSEDPKDKKQKNSSYKLDMLSVG